MFRNDSSKSNGSHHLLTLYKSSSLICADTTECSLVLEHPSTSSTPISGDGVLSGGQWVAHTSHAGLEPGWWNRRRERRWGNAPETEHRLTRMEWTKTRLPEKTEDLQNPIVSSAKNSPRGTEPPTSSVCPRSVRDMSDTQLHTSASNGPNPLQSELALHGFNALQCIRKTQHKL